MSNFTTVKREKFPKTKYFKTKVVTFTPVQKLKIRGGRASPRSATAFVSRILLGDAVFSRKRSSLFAEKNVEKVKSK